MTTGLSRNTIDKFYTCDDAVKLCMESVKSFIAISKDDIIVEPSAGDGSFISSIRSLGCKYLFLDIKPDYVKPEGEHVIKEQDYLTFDPTELETVGKIHVIGNPPFGRQSSLAIKFIKKSCDYADTISFILPSSFKKDSRKSVFRKDFHLVHQFDLPENSFFIPSDSPSSHDVPLCNVSSFYNVPCIFQIWIKRDEAREPTPTHKPNDNWSFVKKNEEPDLSFRRVGVYAGKVDEECESKSGQSHYFIKLISPTNPEQIQNLKTMIFETGNTVGPRSISKQELIPKINTILE